MKISGAYSQREPPILSPLASRRKRFFPPSARGHAGPGHQPVKLERETGFEPATNSLEGCDSTPELLPLGMAMIAAVVRSTTPLAVARLESDMVEADGFEPS